MEIRLRTTDCHLSYDITQCCYLSSDDHVVI